jgi:hypothetical protein
MIPPHHPVMKMLSFPGFSDIIGHHNRTGIQLPGEIFKISLLTLLGASARVASAPRHCGISYGAINLEESNTI